MSLQSQLSWNFHPLLVSRWCRALRIFYSHSLQCALSVLTPSSGSAWHHTPLHLQQNFIFLLYVLQPHFNGIFLSIFIFIKDMESACRGFKHAAYFFKKQIAIRRNKTCHLYSKICIFNTKMAYPFPIFQVTTCQLKKALLGVYLILLYLGHSRCQLRPHTPSIKNKRHLHGNHWEKCPNWAEMIASLWTHLDPLLHCHHHPWLKIQI